MTTAGGLVFIGAVNNKPLRAFDSKTGKELWANTGKQYVAIVAGDTLNVFTLP
jgi:glucose dehydrogenase